MKKRITRKSASNAAGRSRKTARKRARKLGKRVIQPSARTGTLSREKIRKTILEVIERR